MNILLRTLLLLAFTGWCGTASASQIQAADIVSVDGVEWAQPDLFLDLTWDDTNAVCPGGVCANQTLNGHDVGGWSWANVDDMNQFFNHYIGYEELGPGPDFYVTNPDTLTAVFFGDGWRVTGSFIGFPFILGSLSDSNNAAAMLWERGDVCGFFSCASAADTVATDIEQSAFIGPDRGAWLYRDVSPVPLPAAAWLFISAIAGLAGAKRLSQPKVTA